MAESRIKNTVKNTSISLVLHIITLFGTFIGRTVFIKLLGSQYLGISGLFTNYLSILSLADMGLTTAFLYCLYGPIARNDEEKIASLLHYYRKVYYLLALVVALVGLAMIPIVLGSIRGINLAKADLVGYYILFLANSVCSYFNTYRILLFKADQKIYIVNIITSFFSLASTAVQIVILFYTHNYYFYLISMILITLSTNFVLSFYAKKKYPSILRIDADPLDFASKKFFSSSIKKLFIYKFSAIIINSTDNIIISLLLGTVIVGYYSNYQLLIATITAFIGILITSVQGSLGHLSASSSPQKKIIIFEKMLVIFYMIGTFSACCFIGLLNSFIGFWLKNPQYLLSQRDVVLIVFTFFVTCISNPIWLTRESNGLFNRVQNYLLAAALLNIILSLIFGKFWGVGGIIFATGISRICTMFILEPKIIYKTVFDSPVKNYWLMVLRLLFEAILVFVTFMLLTQFEAVTLPLMFAKISIAAFLTGIGYIFEIHRFFVKPNKVV